MSNVTDREKSGRVLYGFCSGRVAGGVLAPWADAARGGNPLVSVGG